MPEPTPPDGEQAARYFVAFFQGEDRHDPFGSVERHIVPIVQEQLDEHVVTEPGQTEIDVWVESLGGDAHAAYKLFLDLRSRCRKLRAVIPNYAKSAATLLVLGAEEIYMAAAAELGPLDAQIEHPDREGVTVSALDVSKAMGFLGNFALDYVVQGGLNVYRSTELPRAAVLRELTRFSALLLRPMVAKLDPHLVHRATNQLDIAHRYARAMLNMRNMPEGKDLKAKDATRLAERLCEHYPAHEFVISRHEAKEIGLPVRAAEEYDRWPQVQHLHRSFSEGVFAIEETGTFIRVFDEVGLDAFFQDDDEGDSEDGPTGAATNETPDERRGGRADEEPKGNHQQEGARDPQSAGDTVHPSS
jgi:hypothetical protein